MWPTCSFAALPWPTTACLTCSAVNVASLFYLTPPTTALLAWLLFGETLAGSALAGMALAVWGVYLSRR